VENQTGIISGLSNCINDERDQRYTHHKLEGLLSQRIYQIAAGYEDANDCDELRGDNILKMCSGQLPQSGNDLASQPTMSRFENSVRRSELYRVAEHFALCFVNSYATQPEVIIIDCDDTNNNAYGNQLRLFLHSAAYVLIHTLQKEALKHTQFVNSTMKTVQLKLLKTAAYVRELKTKIKIVFPQSYAYKGEQSMGLRIFSILRC